MSRCLPEGDWRAYLDGELAPEETARARAHLAECSECAARQQGIAERASRVGALMMELEMAPQVAPAVVPNRSGWKWAAAGLAVAAALTGAFVLAPKREGPAAAPQAQRVLATSPVLTAPAAGMAVKRAAAPRIRRAKAHSRYFLAFDDEPIDTGTVMRVALEGGMEADVIVDGSGRPRAIRAIQ